MYAHCMIVRVRSGAGNGLVAEDSVKRDREKERKREGWKEDKRTREEKRNRKEKGKEKESACTEQALYIKSTEV